jgi:putative SOS response-associated peptidase YedK
VIPFEAHDFDRWLTCTVKEAREMLKVPPVELFNADPVDAEVPEVGRAPPIRSRATRNQAS